MWGAAMRAVDTNLLVRLATRDDPGQVAAAEVFVAGGAWVSQIVLVEFVRVLASVYGLEAARLVTAVEILLNHQHLTVEDSDVVEAALRQYRKDSAAGFSACLVLEVARKAGHLPLGTFDRALGRLPGAKRLEARVGRTRLGSRASNDGPD
jgi:predicted nucleic-acid-binding protein